MNLIGISLITKDVLALTDFYSEVLGVRFEGNSTHMESSGERVSLSIFSEQSMEQLSPGSMFDYGSGNTVINFEVKNVDEEYEKLRKTDIEFIKLPTTHPWGARSMWFRDLDGNIVNFVTRAKN
ncbi:VOC family protein [Clostridium manihotivorum]|uniref:VOC family protein n=1 Tax=Clostridium manihotivorum TaxID=2320868 RepID=UPI0013E28F22|nr:VOC family protein [Clostridium manihotivorum]